MLNTLSFATFLLLKNRSSPMQLTSGPMSGIPMAQQQGTPPALAPQQIKDLRPSVTTNINLTFIVLEKGPLSRIGEAGPLVSVALVADATAAVHLQLWGPECDAFQPGDIVRLTNGVFSFHKNNLVLRAGKKGALEKTGEFTMVFSENVNMSKLQWVPDPINPKLWNPVGFNPHAPPGNQYHHGAILGNPRGPFH